MTDKMELLAQGREAAKRTYEEKLEMTIEHGLPWAKIVFDANHRQFILIDGVIYDPGTFDPNLLIKAFRRIGPKIEAVACNTESIAQ